MIGGLIALWLLVAIVLVFLGLAVVGAVVAANAVGLLVLALLARP
jgi:hypothetical protein